VINDEDKELSSLNYDAPRLINSNTYYDERGSFREIFRSEWFLREFSTQQANFSFSNKGVVRGLHFNPIFPGQRKVISCLQGSIFDVMINIQKDSVDFGKILTNTLTSKTSASLYIPFGFAHGFQALEEGTIVAYLASSTYDPIAEKAINPLDPHLNIEWPSRITYVSEKDRNAPSLMQYKN
jgi:dTDP-4-dehydrorhamnose 3,5-epimerase